MLEVKVYRWLQGIDDAGSFVFPYIPEQYPSVSEWFIVNTSSLGGAMTRLGLFLLDAPVQGASCEQLFKDFGQFNTKKRNRLRTDKMIKCTHIKYDMKEKYGEAASDKQRHKSKQACENSHKNRFIRTEEYERLVSDTQANDDYESVGPTTATLAILNGNKDDFDSDVDEDGEEASDYVAAMFDDTDEQTKEMRFIMAAFESATPTEPNMLDKEASVDVALRALDDDPLLSNEEDDVDLSFDALLARTEEQQHKRSEDEPEKRPDEMNQIPLNNPTAYPQENAHYFAAKNYVRKDKYTLDAFIYEDILIPSLRSAFKHKQAKSMS